MRLKIVYIFLLVFTLTACKRDDTTSLSFTLTGKWKLVKYEDSRKGTSEAEPSNIERSIIIDFIDDGTTGSMSGQTVTNAVGGEYKISKSGKFTTIRFGGTKIGEPDWGDKFWFAIAAASSYERRGVRLSIYFNADHEKMEFIRN